MNQSTRKPYTEAELARQALEMLAIGNVAVRRAQERNRALGIANYYSIGGRIVSDVTSDQQTNWHNLPSHPER
jgi:hypothetical protein